jgi:hypothetical protein
MVDYGVCKMINKSLLFLRICAVTIAISISFGSTIFFSSAFSDKGAQWISVNHMLSEHLLVHDIALFGANEETIILASDAGAYVSEDGAMSWTNASKGLQHPEVQCLAVDHTGTHIFGGTRRNGAIKYLPATGNWVRYSTNLPARSIHALKTSSEFLYAGTNYEGLFRVKIGSERWSDLTFDDKNTILKDCFIQDLAIINDDRIFLATDKGILFTEDAGISWKYHTDNALRLKQFTCIEYHPLHKLLIAGTDGKGLVFSKDFGKSWLNASLNHPDIAQAYIKAISFHPEFADFWYIASDREGVFSSEDGGKTWLSINQGLSNTRIQSMITLRSDTFSLLAGTVGSGVFKYLSVFPPQAPSWNYTIGQENVQISWKASEEGSFPIAGYAIYRSKDVTPMQWEELIRLGASTRTWIDEKVAWGDIWLYSIRAFDNQEKPLFSSFADIKRIVVDDPPTLILQHPPEGFETEEESIVVQGIVSDQGSGVKSLKLFHKPSQGQAQEQALSWNSEGKFETQLKLSLGAQELILRAEDQQGNITEVKRQILRKELVKELIIKLRIGSKTARIGDRETLLPVAPQIFRGRTMVPLRFLAEAFGAKVQWLSSRQEIQITYREKFITLWLNQTRVLIEDLLDSSKPPIQKQLDVYPYLNQGTTMIPIRFISDEFGARVDWKADIQEITIHWIP